MKTIKISISDKDYRNIVLEAKRCNCSKESIIKYYLIPDIEFLDDPKYPN